MDKENFQYNESNRDLPVRNFCKTCGHSKDDHRGVATICMKQIGKNSDQLCSCNWFNDGVLHVLPIRQNASTIKSVEDSNQGKNL
jgi:hypothetical protein